MNEELGKVECPDCKIENSVVRYGYGYVATCSNCKKIIYNSKEKPKPQK
jgi:uncharacterized paraquat-inducible protein A